MKLINKRHTAGDLKKCGLSHWHNGGRQSQWLLNRMCCVGSSKHRSTYLHGKHTFSILMLIVVNVIVCQVCCTRMQIAMEHGESEQRSILQSIFFLCLSWNPDVIETKHQHFPLHFQRSFVRSFLLQMIMQLRCILIVECLSRQNGRLCYGLFSIFNSCEWRRIVPKWWRVNVSWENMTTFRCTQYRHTDAHLHCVCI